MMEITLPAAESLSEALVRNDTEILWKLKAELTNDEYILEERADRDYDCSGII